MLLLLFHVKQEDHAQGPQAQSWLERAVRSNFDALEDVPKEDGA